MDPQYVTMPAAVRLQEALHDVAGSFFTAEDYAALIARFTDASGVTLNYTAFPVGNGFWRIPGKNWCLISPTIAGQADHTYLLYPEGLIRALTTIRSASVTTAPAEGADPLRSLTDSAAEFLDDAPAVAVGDLVILTQTGAAVTVTETPDHTTIPTTALPLGGQFTAGQSYVIARPPGSDTAPTYQITGRPVDFRGAQSWVLEQLLTHRSLIEVRGEFGDRHPDATVATIRQRLQELRGIRGGR